MLVWPSTSAVLELPSSQPRCVIVRVDEAVFNSDGTVDIRGEATEDVILRDAILEPGTGGLFSMPLPAAGVGILPMAVPPAPPPLQTPCLRVSGAGMSRANGLYTLEELEGYAGPPAYHLIGTDLWLFRWHQTWWHLGELRQPLLSEEAFTAPVIYTAIVQEPRDVPPSHGWTGDVMRDYGPAPAPTLSMMGTCSIAPAITTHAHGDRDVRTATAHWLGPATTPAAIDSPPHDHPTHTVTPPPHASNPGCIKNYDLPDGACDCPRSDATGLCLGTNAAIAVFASCVLVLYIYLKWLHRAPPKPKLRFCPAPPMSKLPKTRRMLQSGVPRVTLTVPLEAPLTTKELAAGPPARIVRYIPV